MESERKPEVEIQFTKQPYIEDVGPRKIKSIKFSMFSGAEIRNAAELQVWSNGFYGPNREPKPNALLDPRMGPANKSVKHCATCDGNFTECPGHFGYLNLVLPVFNVGYFSAILQILKCICKSCARILHPEKDRRDYLRKMRSSKMEALQKSALAKQILKKVKDKCSRCGYVNGKVKKAGSILGIVHDRSKHHGIYDECEKAISHTKQNKASFQIVQVLNPVRVLSLFRRMLDEDCELLYLSDRPEKLILTDIAVPPIAIRPSVFVDGGKNSNEDDISSKLNTIIQANTSLRQDLHCTSPTSKCLAAWELLQVEVAQYINSDVRGVPPSMQPTKPLRGFIQRLKGKQGRFRGNLSGKRVEYTGRTVISPDPNLKITEVAIPILMAQILTYPELVSQHNIEKLRKCVANGAQKYPGANFIRYPNGNMSNLRYGKLKRIAEELKYGDIVERHLEDGDVVLFNRQPSLHRMSIMSHRARIMPWRTLRFNESVCNPYNADFDGDEMNMHVPQTEEARTEALMLMGVQNNLCTPKNGEILVASTQDFLTSSFLITRKDTFYDRASFSLMCSYMGDGMDSIDLPTPALIKPVELWTGKQLFSVLVRPHAHMRVYLNFTVLEKTYSKSGETMCPNDGFVYFRNSELICGQLGKATLGNGNKDGLFSVLLRDYNAHAAAACMNRLAKLSARWIGNHGFSIGVDDVQPGELLNHQKKARIEEGYEACYELIRSYNKGNLKLQPGCDAAQTLEAEITGVLNKIRETTAKVCMEELHWRNSPLIMSQCGSKGSPINISQMIACVGQQSVGGRRAPNGFIDRSLPHFPRKSKAPAAKGFVANSFYTGLTATEFFFHTMGGREGLVDTAVKTADTGYMSRRLIKALEDLSIHYDNTVRNANGGVVQFLYGDDGMDPSKMEGKSGTPLNLERLYMKVKATCPARAHASLSPSEILRFVDARLSRHDMTPEGGCSDAFKISLLDFLQKSITTLKNTRRGLQLDEEKNGLDSLEKITANISGITLQQLQVFLETCISRYHLKRIEAGTAIGAIGAQSIGEPGTQMTLKTFHFAGVASMNVTLGVPRIKEIINGAQNISTPIITATLECNNDVKSARIVKGCIEKTVLGEVAKSMKIVLTSRQASIIVTLDMERIQCLQLRISAYSVQQSILHHPKAKLKLQHVEVLDDRKLRILPPVGDRSKLHFELHSLKSMLPKVIVKGIPTVERAVINKDKGKYNLLVEGTNLRAVMGTPGVDGCKTTSNHIIEVQGTLGIEAARKCIIDEIQYTMASHGMSIDIRHMMLLADLMTSKGEVLGITRFGIQKMKESVLMLASFEKTADHLFNASVNGRDDKIEGVSECIIMGIPMQIGTGILKVRQRLEQIPKLTYGLDPIIS
ncbi:RNA polymerase [Macleaya cordata]|uniref:DNA-directed RNA polymerase subunit n=1 Tax=Macleaya cordata TaxID=56857 RepID=A0A200R699_MACCD|nr:RNA polymerase [Macleaya cordata]